VEQNMTVNTDMKLFEIVGLQSWFYHGTTRERLTNIIQHGLTAQETSDWSGYDDDPELGEWSVGKIFFTRKMREALFYARMTQDFTGGHPVLLRVPVNAVTSPQHDVMGRGKDIYTEQPIAPQHIEVWNGKGWLPIGSLG